MAQKLGQREAVHSDLQSKYWANLKFWANPVTFTFRYDGARTFVDEIPLFSERDRFVMRWRGPTGPPHRRFRDRGTEYVSRYGVKWKWVVVQSDNAKDPHPPSPL